MKKTLSRLRHDGIICQYLYIRHKGEYNPEKGKREKDHFHVAIVPEDTIDTDVVSKEFSELDPNNPLPLGLVTEVSEQFKTLASFILYVLHDEEFMEATDRVKEFQYNFLDIHGSDKDWFERLVEFYDRPNGDFEILKRPKYRKVERMVVSGQISLSQAYRRGWINSSQRNSLRKAIIENALDEAGEEEYAKDLKIVAEFEQRQHLGLKQNIGSMTENEADIENYLDYKLENKKMQEQITIANGENNNDESRSEKESE